LPGHVQKSLTTFVVLAACASATTAHAFSRATCFVAPNTHNSIDTSIVRMNLEIGEQRHAEDKACAYYARGLLFHFKGDTDKALADYSSAIEWASDYGDAYAARGDAYADLGQRENAERDYAAAAALPPDSPEALTARCWVRALRGRPLALALRDCDESLRRQPGDFDALTSRCLVNARISNFPAAIADCDAALAQKPHNASALFIRALAKLRAGEKSDGGADLAAAKEASNKVEGTFAIYGLSP
jgi:tetratricopeptide (TPR) repeat protein